MVYGSYGGYELTRMSSVSVSALLQFNEITSMCLVTCSSTASEAASCCDAAGASQTGQSGPSAGL